MEAKLDSPNLADLEMAFAEQPACDTGARLVKFYLEANRFIEALVIATRCTKIWPDEPGCHESLCEVHMKRGHLTKIRNTLDKLPAGLQPSRRLLEIAAEVGHPLGKPAQKPMQEKPGEAALLKVVHEETREKPAIEEKRKPRRPVANAVLQAARLQSVEEVKRTRTSARRTILLSAGLCLLLGGYIAWTWHEGSLQEEANGLILAARKLMKPDLEAGYRQALQNFEKALSLVPDDTAALSGAAYASVLLGGEKTDNREFLFSAKKYISRASKIGADSLRLEVAEGLLCGYAGDIAKGKAIIGGLAGNAGRSPLVLDSANRLDLLAGEPERAVSRTHLAFQYRDLRLDLSTARANLAVGNYQAALKLVELAAALSPSHPDIAILRKQGAELKAAKEIGPVQNSK